MSELFNKSKLASILEDEGLTRKTSAGQWMAAEAPYQWEIKFKSAHGGIRKRESMVSIQIAQKGVRSPKTKWLMTLHRDSGTGGMGGRAGGDVRKLRGESGGWPNISDAVAAAKRILEWHSHNSEEDLKSDRNLSSMVSKLKPPSKLAPILEDEGLIKTGLVKTAGGTDFYDWGAGSDPRKIFSALQNHARAEQGTDVYGWLAGDEDDDWDEGYSGSIAEKDGYKIRSHEKMSKREALRFAEKDVDNNDKWGPAFAIPSGNGWLFYGIASS